MVAAWAGGPEEVSAVSGAGVLRVWTLDFDFASLAVDEHGASLRRRWGLGVGRACGARRLGPGLRRPGLRGRRAPGRSVAGVVDGIEGCGSLACLLCWCWALLVLA